VPPAEPTSHRLEPGAAPRDLTVASWNLDWLNHRSQRGPVRRSPADYERLRRYAQRLHADVIAVQEVDGEEALRQVFDPAEYDYHLAAQRDVQRVGFAYRKGLVVDRHADLTALDVGGVREGADLTVHVNGKALRLLAVHLKSGCFAAPLSSPKPACVKLHAQLPVLERWIDERARASEPFLVLGDFNRRLNAQDPFYVELDDGDPPNADLSLLGAGHASRCWGGKYPEFIDHMLLSRDAAPWLKPNSFEELVYDATDTPFRPKLSDHCPIEVLLTPGAAFSATPAPDSVVAPSARLPGARLPIKGNINARHQKLYHLPGCSSYADTRIDESRGERWFATEAEAIAAGWQRAPGCRR
jgi:endonuclease/exonuclease/phosphatase family metal-dependent hydrolase